MYRRTLSASYRYTRSVSRVFLMLGLLLSANAGALAEGEYIDIVQGESIATQMAKVPLLILNKNDAPGIFRVLDQKGDAIPVTWNIVNDPTGTIATFSPDNTKGLLTPHSQGHVTVHATWPNAPHGLDLSVWVFPDLKLTLMEKSGFKIKTDAQNRSSVDIDNVLPANGATAIQATASADSSVFTSGQAHYDLRWKVTDESVLTLAKASGVAWPKSTDGSYLIPVDGTVRFMPQNTLGPATVEVSAGSHRAQITVTVVKPVVVPAVTDLQVKEKTKVTLAASVQDGNGRTLEERTPVWAIVTNTVNAVSLSEDQKQLTGDKIGTAKLSVTYSPNQSQSIVNVTVVPQLDMIDLDVPAQMLVNETTKLSIRLKDANGVAFPETQPRSFQLSATRGALNVRQAPDDPTGKTLIVTALQTGLADLHITFTPDNGEAKTQTFHINVVSVSRFDRLDVELQVLTDSYAAYAFGKKASQEFYAVQVTIKNNLKQQNSTEAGNSILIYSDTFETPVKVEKRLIHRKNSAETWTEVSVEDQVTRGVNPDSGDPYIEVGMRRVLGEIQENSRVQNGVIYPALRLRLPLNQITFPYDAKDYDQGASGHTIRGVVMDHNENVILDKVTYEPLGSSVRVEGDRFYPLKPGKVTIKATLTTINERHEVVRYVGTFYVNFQENPKIQPYLYHYRPYSFDMIDSTFDARNRQNPRPRTFNILAGIGSMATFLTSIIKFDRRGNDIKVLNQYNGLLLPSLEKLWPDQTENQRQTTRKQLMAYREEVSFGESKTRILFYPKESFTGYLPGYETRISAIDTKHFTVQVAIVSDKQTTGGAENTPGKPTAADSTNTPPQ